MQGTNINYNQNTKNRDGHGYGNHKQIFTTLGPVGAPLDNSTVKRFDHDYRQGQAYKGKGKMKGTTVTATDRDSNCIYTNQGDGKGATGKQVAAQAHRTRGMSEQGKTAYSGLPDGGRARKDAEILEVLRRRGYVQVSKDNLSAY